MDSQARGGSAALAAAARRRLRVQAGRILAALSAVYVIAQFYRSSVAVIAPDLARDIGLSAEALGGMTAAFFLAYAVAVVPAGMMFDRIGPRRTISALLLVGVTGSLVFATAASYTGLTVGRVLMGVGSAGILSGALVVCARWFPGTRYATVVGLLIGVGATGNLLATPPLALASEWVGWRWAFAGAAGATLALAAAHFLIVRDAPPGHPYHEREPESWRQVFDGLFEAWSTPELAYIIAIHTATYGSLLTILGLWGGPYLFDVHGLAALERGNVLLAMTLAAIGGSIAYGPLDRLFNTRKGVIVAGATVTVAVLAVLALGSRARRLASDAAVRRAWRRDRLCRGDPGARAGDLSRPAGGARPDHAHGRQFQRHRRTAVCERTDHRRHHRRGRVNRPVGLPAHVRLPRRDRGAHLGLFHPRHRYQAEPAGGVGRRSP